ncbi:imm11 family protein [Pseudomonas alabamensis]|uniref:imm11 family protein n=1 Tax=Pseudomonas alabamensis TaxID=3064349 RepID=UPI0011A1D3AC
MLMKMLMGSDDYPERYWLKYDRDVNPDYFKFSGGERCEGASKSLKFHLKGRVSMSSFLRYDFLSSDGPDVMTEKLARILENACPAGIQLVPAEVISNGKAWSGYYVVNILNIDKAFDMDRCVYSPLLKSMPEGPKKFERISLLSSSPKHDIFLAEEDRARVIVSDALAQRLATAQLKGVALFEGLDSM